MVKATHKVLTVYAGLLNIHIALLGQRADSILQRFQAARLDSVVALSLTQTNAVLLAGHQVLAKPNADRF